MKAKQEQYAVYIRTLGQRVRNTKLLPKCVLAYDMPSAILAAGRYNHFYYVNDTIIAGYDDTTRTVVGVNTTHIIDLYKTKI